jgi:hypothetical protein
MHNGLADLLARLERDGDSLSADEACLTEKPDCAWRGLMVDLARQRHPLPYVLSYVDLCWKNRASHLQLHFTDSPSFTLPIEAYPKLPTEGRAYTREEIGILTEYAAARGITLVPEVDVPGHSDPFFRSYPELFGTTGVLPASAEAFDALRGQFAAQTVKKTYLALVEGTVAAGGTLENDLVHDPTLPFCRMIDLHHNRLTRAQCAGLKPLHAVTAFSPIGFTTVENEERTLLEVTIFTGVTHQIRAQLALAGMHIVNDRLYGAFAVENQTGHCLHALAASFRHPASNLPAEIRTPLPAWAETRGA